MDKAEIVEYHAPFPHIWASSPRIEAIEGQREQVIEVGTVAIAVSENLRGASVQNGGAVRLWTLSSSPAFVTGERVMLNTIPTVVLVSRRGHKQTFLAALFAGTTSVVLTMAPPAHAQSTGVAVCDDFLAKYEACISSKVPAAQQSMFKGQFDQTRKTWSDM